MPSATDIERTLYGFWLSPYMAQVAQLLDEAGLAYRYERVSPYQGSTHSAEHKARNPLGKIPTLRDTNGVDVAESQAICRYLARVYPEARRFYPIDDPVHCAEVDATNDFITFSIGGPFFNWFVFSGYLPKAWKLAVEHEANVYNRCSTFLLNGALARLVASSRLQPFLLGAEPLLPDFQLYHMLELGKTLAGFFYIQTLDLLGTNPALQEFYDSMSERDSTRSILARQAAEREITKKELFEEFGPAYLKIFDKRVLEQILGHEV